MGMVRLGSIGTRVKSPTKSPTRGRWSPVTVRAAVISIMNEGNISDELACVIVRIAPIGIQPMPTDGERR